MKRTVRSIRKSPSILHISEAFEHAAEFDLIHSHYDFMALSFTRLVKTPVLTTIHGFSSPRIMPVYEKYRDGYFVSISDSDRAPGLNYLATVYNGIDLSLYPLRERGGDDLVFLGRIHPDKGVHLAIAGCPAERAAAAHRGDHPGSGVLPRAGGTAPRSRPSAISDRWMYRARTSCSRVLGRCCT